MLTAYTVSVMFVAIALILMIAANGNRVTLVDITMVLIVSAIWPVILVTFCIFTMFGRGNRRDY